MPKNIKTIAILPFANGTPRYKLARLLPTEHHARVHQPHQVQHSGRPQPGRRRSEGIVGELRRLSGHFRSRSPAAPPAPKSSSPFKSRSPTAPPARSCSRGLRLNSASATKSPPTRKLTSTRAARPSSASPKMPPQRGHCHPGELLAMTAAQLIARVKKGAPPPAVLLLGPEAYDRRRLKEAPHRRFPRRFRHPARSVGADAGRSPGRCAVALAVRLRAPHLDRQRRSRAAPREGVERR
jgi:hypothetical protein